MCGAGHDATRRTLLPPRGPLLKEALQRPSVEVDLALTLRPLKAPCPYCLAGQMSPAESRFSTGPSPL